VPQVKQHRHHRAAKSQAPWPPGHYQSDAELFTHE
jgi:hypothetical protein